MKIKISALPFSVLALLVDGQERCLQLCSKVLFQGNGRTWMNS